MICTPEYYINTLLLLCIVADSTLKYPFVEEISSQHAASTPSAGSKQAAMMVLRGRQERVIHSSMVPKSKRTDYEYH